MVVCRTVNISKHQNKVETIQTFHFSTATQQVMVDQIVFGPYVSSNSYITITR